MRYPDGYPSGVGSYHLTPVRAIAAYQHIPGTHPDMYLQPGVLLGLPYRVDPTIEGYTTEPIDEAEAKQ